MPAVPGPTAPPSNTSAPAPGCGEALMISAQVHLILLAATAPASSRLPERPRARIFPSGAVESPHGLAWTSRGRSWEWARLRGDASRGSRPDPCRCQSLLHPSALYQNISLSHFPFCEPEIQKPFCRHLSRQHWSNL